MHFTIRCDSLGVQPTSRSKPLDWSQETALPPPPGIIRGSDPLINTNNPPPPSSTSPPLHPVAQPPGLAACCGGADQWIFFCEGGWTQLTRWVMVRADLAVSTLGGGGGFGGDLQLQLFSVHRPTADAVFLLDLPEDFWICQARRGRLCSSRKHVPVRTEMSSTSNMFLQGKRGGPGV